MAAGSDGAELLSSFEGGKNVLHFGVDMGVTIVFSLVIYFFALSRRLPAETVRERMQSGADELDQPDSSSPAVAATEA